MNLYLENSVLIAKTEAAAAANLLLSSCKTEAIVRKAEEITNLKKKTML